MRTKITTDWHIGVKRSAGTTPFSQIALGRYLREALKAQLGDEDHLIAGDLLDSFTVDTGELMATYHIFADWLRYSGKQLALVRGNHDYHESGSKVSSFDLLSSILKTQFPDQVTVATDVTEWKQFVLVPHLANNEILDIAIEALSRVENKVVVFHANVDNKFTAESQHSLNLSMGQVTALTLRGNLVICGHEHQNRKLLDGRVLILGNGAPSSVADCLGNSHKYSALVSGTDYTLTKIWDAATEFTEVNWQDIPATGLETFQFIRVTGDCTADQAALMVNTIANLRQSSNAYVISNAVKVEGVAQMEGLAEMSLSEMSKFDVLGALLEEMTEREQKTIKELLK